ncbi:hypothetical protein IV102_23820 [bacterium]|nr:hypothetical protein [bacterium]
MTKRVNRWWFLWVFLCLCGCVAPPGPTTPNRPRVARPRPAGQAEEGLRFKLSPANAGSDASQSLPQASPTPLTDAELQPLLKRLPPIGSQPDDRKAFALRAGSQPPPRTARTIQQSFPPKPSRSGLPPVPADLAVKVLTVAPRGPVSMAPHLQITFNQAMVPLSTVEQLELRGVPVKLTPQPAGKWRWLGTHTLMFAPDVRFPMATEFRLEIPAGATAANGARLKSAEHFSFETPPLRLEQPYPTGGPQILKPLIFMRFNQDVEAAMVARLLRLSGGAPTPKLRQATPEELALDDTVHGMVEGAGQRWVAVVPQQDLRPGHTYTVELPPGLPSKEGPLLTQKAQAFSFSTYDPLKIVWKTEDTPPLQSWTVQFNNALDADKFDPKWVKVSPELSGLKVSAAGSGLSIRGRSKGRTQYTVTLAPPLLDQFGQKLGHKEKFIVKVGSAQPTFVPPTQQFIVLDPKGPRQLTCQVINYPKLKVQAWKVSYTDWDAYLKYLQTRGQNLKDQPVVPPGTLVIDTVVDTHAKVDEVTEVPIDLSKALPGGHGHMVVRIDPDPQKYPEDWRRQVYYGWVQSTDLGLDCVSDRQQVVAWVSNLASGRPTEGVDVRLWPNPARGTSNDEGLATLPLQGSARLLIAQKGDDVAILPHDFYYWGSSEWTSSSSSDSTLWHVLDDRKLYRPGESVHLKGWVRLNQYGPKGDLLDSPMKSLQYVLYDSLGNEIRKGKAPVGRLGGFHFEVPLPKNLNLGQTRLDLVGDSGGSFSHTFQVEEFRRPEFEVSAEARPATSQIGSNSILTASAAYFSGGPLANAKVDWSVSSSPTSYSPPGWEGYTFGTWTPWWPCRCWWSEGESYRQVRSNATSQETRTDSKGKSSLQVDFLSVEPPRPHSLSAQATVQDVNRQAWTSNTSVLVHPASLYVGLKSATTFVEKGQPLEMSMVVTDLDGKAVKDRPVQIKAYRLDWDERGRSVQADVHELVLTSSSQANQFKVPTHEGGTYQVEARLQDDQNRSNYSQMTVWVAGGKQPPASNVAQEQITMVPGQQEYQVGDTAEVLVQAPFAPAELLVTTRRNGLAKVERLQAPTGSTTLKIPVEELHIPGLQIQVDALGSKPREEEKGERPAYAVGALTLNISSAPRKLTVALKPAQAKLEPGGSTTVQVDLKDYQGKPVAGEVTLLVVDESVLALTGYDPADPLGSFCQLRGADCADHHLRQYLTLSRVEESMPETETRASSSTRLRGGVAYDEESGSMDALAAPAPGAAPMDDGRVAPKESQRRAENKDKNAAQPRAQAPQLRVRTNFAALALFAPAVQTDARGQAQVEVKLPDNLTRYRIIGLAAAGVKQFGKGESSLVARQPLMVRPSPPRFLNFGDRFEMPVMVQNQTEAAMQVTLACRGSNARVGDKTAAGYRVQVPANDRLEVRIPCAADQAGTARFQFGASSGPAGDAAEVSLPVWTPATTEAFATYGIIDEGAASQPLEKPVGVWPQFGGLTVTTSSTALSELSDAFLYLTNYPFECSEQVSSRMLAAAALKDVLTAFQAPGMATTAELRAAMNRDLERLRGQQNDDGGWDYWTRGQPSVAYLSVHVAHTLVRVKDKGFAVNPSMLEQALTYVGDIESHIPSDYSPACRRSIRAYALYVLQLAGRANPEKARRLAGEVKLDELGTETMGWLLPTLDKDRGSQTVVAEILGYLDNHSTQTAATAQFTAGYSDQGYLVLYSDRRDDGLLLEALITTRPKHPLIPKLVRGLLDHRSAGHWANTQENCWVLLALDKYFHQYESVTPNFVASIWLGDSFAGEQAFRGRDKDEKELRVPIDQMKGPLTLAKTGAGRLYYRIGLNYAPHNLKQAAADYGFTVQRRYEAIKDNQDVTRQADGSWHIKAGSDIKVTVTMQAPSRRYHVALVDPLPAGLEAVNPSLLGSGDRTQAPQNRLDGWWSAYWYEHQNMRDERVEAFTQLLWEGVYTYSYVARATTPGEFVVPPAKAEEMYHPETFGRSSSDRVVVK